MIKAKCKHLPTITSYVSPLKNCRTVVRQFLYTVCCAHHHNIIKSPKRTNPPWTFWYAVGPVTQYRKVHRTFLPNFFASLKIWTLVFESLQPEIIKIAKQINICFAILVRWKGLRRNTLRV